MKNTLKITAAGDREILITRDFDAPRALVWDAMTNRELLSRWMSGPAGWEMTAHEDERRVGGTCRRAWKGPGGVEMSMSGVYREIRPPERLVRTDTFDSGCIPQMGEQLTTLELADKGETTTMTLTVLYPSREARDGAIASGMEHGMEAGYERLDEILESVEV